MDESPAPDKSPSGTNLAPRPPGSVGYVVTCAVISLLAIVLFVGPILWLRGTGSSGHGLAFWILVVVLMLLGVVFVLTASVQAALGVGGAGGESRGLRRWLAILAGIVAFVAVSGAVIGISWAWPVGWLPNSAEAALESHVAEYCALTGLKDRSDKAGNSPGKVVVVDRANKRLDRRVFRALPESLRAGSPDEVRTVVWLKWDESFEGWYENPARPGDRSAEAYVQTCVVQVIDLRRRVIVGRQKFNAPAPPRTSEGGDVHVKIDLQGIVDFIKTNVY